MLISIGYEYMFTQAVLGVDNIYPYISEPMTHPTESPFDGPKCNNPRKC